MNYKVVVNNVIKNITADNHKLEEGMFYLLRDGKEIFGCPFDIFGGFEVEEEIDEINVNVNYPDRVERYKEVADIIIETAKRMDYDYREVIE